MIDTFISEQRLESLRESVKERMSEYRFAHTLGVESAAAHLGRIFLPNRVNELRAAAILHDVTKELDVDTQLDYIEGCAIVKAAGHSPEQALHSFSGAALILAEFPEYATEDILHAVMYHTLGDPGMNLFAAIIYLSDFIEDGRSYFDSIRIRKWLYAALEADASCEDKLRSFYRAMLDSIDCTVKSVCSRGYTVDPRTLATKKAIEALI